jgi:organic hydroperoxide reductase OsmC/OhrA
MSKSYSHRVVAWWASGRTGMAKSDHAPNVIHFTAPPKFGGVKDRWTPEDLLLCAIASCFTTTFHTIADYSKFEYTDLEVESEAAICKAESGYSYEYITLHPRLTISHEGAENVGYKLLEKAKQLCLVSRVIATPIRFQMNVEIAKKTVVTASLS